MAVIPTQTDMELIQLRNRNIKIKIELLNFQMQTVSSIEGLATDGSVSIDATADIRRTCSLTLEIKDKNFQISEGSEIWIDKYIKVYAGSDNPRTGETTWWNLGIFLINNPSRVYSSVNNTLTFEGLDLMAKLTSRRNGQLQGAATVVPTGSSIANVVRSTITELGGFTNYVIEDAGYVTPYEIKKDMGSTIYDLLVELRDLYSDWEMFFDTDGVFHWQQIPDGVNSPVILNFNDLRQSIIISDQVDVNFENVKNNIIVYGRVLDTGEQIQAYISDIIEDSPFNINKIGNITYIVNDENIYSNALALQRADYELYLHSRLNDSIVLETIPIYWINDVNVKIAYSNPAIGIDGEYLIKTLEIPLTLGNNMTINAMKIYPESTALGGMTDEQRAVYFAQLYWISQYGTLDDYLFFNAGKWTDGRFIVCASIQHTELIGIHSLLVDISTGDVEPMDDITIDEQAEFLASQWWIDNYGSTEGVSFHVVSTLPDGTFMCSVNNTETTAVIQWLIVDLKTGEVTERQ